MWIDLKMRIKLLFLPYKKKKCKYCCLICEYWKDCKEELIEEAGPHRSDETVIQWIKEHLKDL